jgi:hypothetical protein
MSAGGGAFLTGAAGRLLPLSIPLRFFGAATVFHALAWLALLAGSETWAHHAGGPGWPLAALHCVTLGVLGMSAIGASLQLLPVATRQPLVSQRLAAAIWWLYTPGVAILALGMGPGPLALLMPGAAMVAIALAVYAGLLARNLLGARGMPGVVAHGWVALASLAVLLLSALSLAAGWVWGFWFDRGATLQLHVAFAAYGFMGMLSLGIAYILVPMFALGPVPDQREQGMSFAWAVLALALVALAAFGVAPRAMRSTAVVSAAVAVVLHLRLMRRVQREGMRRALGRSFTLVRIGWGSLLASLAVALAMIWEAPIEGLQRWFGLFLIGGWLTSFVFGILQRIVPFLASMHATRGRRSPTPSSLTDERALRIHFVCHCLALTLLALAIALDSAAVTALAAGLGFIGAAWFVWFFVGVLRRMRRVARGA